MIRQHDEYQSWRYQMKFSAIALSLVVGLSACDAYAGGHATAPVAQSNGILVDDQGMSLYTFDPDTATSSACNGGCAVNWPPLTAPADADETGQFTTITRNDGTKQWAYAGQPLYLWVNDRHPGDTTGDGVGGNWHLARP
jgi:predicted lipoprotein with Yx(FWY)xxD motif